MQQTRVIKAIPLAPGEYRVAKCTSATDCITPITGELVGKSFPIWGFVPSQADSHIVVIYREYRGWRTLWRWKSLVQISDGNLRYIAFELPSEVLPSDA